MTRCLLFAVLCLTLVVGCGDVGKKEPIALDKIPENVMKVAKEKLPGVTFTRAVVKPNGEYEILGRDPKGKTREIDITPQGVVTEIE